MKPRCPGPDRISRRELLQVGAISTLGLTLPQLLRADAGAGLAGPRPSADACILIFLNGGPSHLDMWDMKPAAPVEIRGEFRPVPTTVPGSVRTAFMAASFTESTRLICPAPTATLWPARAKTIAFDLTCFATFHANSSAIHSSSVGARCVLT